MAVMAIVEASVNAALTAVETSVSAALATGPVQAAARARATVAATDAASNSVTRMVPGKLILLFEGVGIQMACGHDIIHCNLRRTLHLADETRDSVNWTRVHGP